MNDRGAEHLIVSVPRFLRAFAMGSENIIVCDCGARVRMPPQLGNRAFRCPVCKVSLTPTGETSWTDVDAHFGAGQQLAPGELGATCPICQTAISTDESAMRCPSCDQIHHAECWSEVGGCGTYGCVKAPQFEKPEPKAPTRAWGDAKECPACGESIKSIALRCRYCGTNFHTADPLTRADLRRRKQLLAEQTSLRTNTAVLFVLSLLGCTAPIAGLIGSAYLMPKTEQLRKCGPLYLVLSWIALVLSGIYTVMIAVFFLFEWK